LITRRIFVIKTQNDIYIYIYTFSWPLTCAIFVFLRLQVMQTAPIAAEKTLGNWPRKMLTFVPHW
jgi:hypothetical protein